MKNGFKFKTLREYVDAQPRRKPNRDIARELSITQSALNSYLGGHRAPGRDLALRLSREFDISLEGLLDPESMAG